MKLTKIEWVMLLLLAILMCVSGCSAQKPITPVVPGNPDWTIDVNFNYNFANISPCAAGVTTSCVSGFTWGYLNGSTQVPVKTTAVSSYAACPATLPLIPDITCKQAPDSSNNTPFFDVGNSLLPIGGTGVIFFVTVNYFDQTGAALQTSPDLTTTPQIIGANGATGLNVAHH